MVKHQKNIVRKTIHLSQVMIGMTVEFQGEFHTICKQNLPKRGFMGWAFLGDGSKQTITEIKFAVPTAKGIVLR